MTYVPTEQKERQILHISKESNGMHGCIRKQIESFEFGRDTFGFLPTGFLNQVHAAFGSAPLSVCPPPRSLITSGVIWCYIDRVRLVKQVLRLFPAFNYFMQHLPSIKLMGVAILT